MAKKIFLSPMAAILELAAIAALKRKIKDGNIPGITVLNQTLYPCYPWKNDILYCFILEIRFAPYGEPLVCTCLFYLF